MRGVESVCHGVSDDDKGVFLRPKNDVQINIRKGHVYSSAPKPTEAFRRWV